MKKTQSATHRAAWPTRQRALALLRMFPEGISPLEAANRGCYSFTTYLSDLRAAGAEIWQKRTRDGKTFVYRLGAIK